MNSIKLASKNSVQNKKLQKKYILWISPFNIGS